MGQQFVLQNGLDLGRVQEIGTQALGENGPFAFFA
jgi:hypothetical protein